MRAIKLIVAAALLCAAAAPAENIDTIASDYVVLALSAKRLHPDWVEAPEVPEALQSQAASANLDSPAIIRRAEQLLARLGSIPVPADRLDAERHSWLRASLVSLRTQLQAANGTKWPVAEEVELRYGFKPQFKPLSDYDPVLARLDRQLSGSGTLSERINRLRESAVVPPDKILAVQAAALKECRRRAAAHVQLPNGETVEMRWNDDPLFAGNDTYKGNGHSLAEFSRTFKWELDQILWVTCHEIYPGHHTHFSTRSEALLRTKGWPEFGLDQNYGPLIPGAEAVAEYGVGLAFPIEDRIRFERDVLYPIAGLKMRNADDWRAFWTTRRDMLGASATVARDYLDGKLDKEQAKQAFLKYRMMTPDAASKIVGVVDAVGSYVIASDVGWMTIDRRLRQRTRAKQWKAFQRVLREPMTVADLEKL